MPLTHWWRNELKNEMLDLLLEPRTLQRGYFNPKAVRQLLAEHVSGRRDRSYDIWLLLVFELWHRNFLEPRGTFSNVPGMTPIADLQRGRDSAAEVVIERTGAK